MRKSIEWGGEAGPMNESRNDRRAAPQDSVIFFLKVTTILLLAGMLLVLFLELAKD
jgi:hypothetical protein